MMEIYCCHISFIAFKAMAGYCGPALSALVYALLASPVFLSVEQSSFATAFW